MTSDAAGRDPAEVPARPRGRRRAVLMPLLTFGIVAAIFFAQLLRGEPSRLPSPLIGRPAPVFSLPALDGLAVDGKPVPGLSQSELTGTVHVVNVWASWCAPCRDEHPQLMALARSADIRLVGINYKDQPENARRFLGALGNPFAAVGVDVAGRAAIDWGVYGVPETFVVAPDGTIVYKHVGPLTLEALIKGPFADAMKLAAAKR